MELLNNISLPPSLCSHCFFLCFCKFLWAHSNYFIISCANLHLVWKLWLKPLSYDVTSWKPKFLYSTRLRIFFFFLSFQTLVMIFSWTENVIVTCLSYTVVKRTGHQRHTFSIKKVWTLSAHNMPKYGTCFIKVEVNGIDSPLFQITHFYYHLHYPW